MKAENFSRLFYYNRGPELRLPDVRSRKFTWMNYRINPTVNRACDYAVDVLIVESVFLSY